MLFYKILPAFVGLSLMNGIRVKKCPLHAIHPGGGEGRGTKITKTVTLEKLLFHSIRKLHI